MRGPIREHSGRDRIRKRIREFFAVETYDSLQIAGGSYFFRKRLPDQEQPCIYMRNGADGEDQLLIDPSQRETGKYTAVKPLRVSPDGRLLLYEVKEGGERTGTFELLDIETRKRLPDSLPRGYLRGFAFAPGGKSFYYVHERQTQRGHSIAPRTTMFSERHPLKTGRFSSLARTKSFAWRCFPTKSASASSSIASLTRQSRTSI